MSITFPLGKLEFDPPPNWTQTSVGHICDENDGDVQTGPFGSQLHASDYSDEGVPVVMPQDMADGKILTSKIARVDSYHVERLNRHMLRTGDIIFSRRGDVARFAVVNCSEQGWLCGTGSMRIRLNSPGIDTQFLRRFLQLDSVGKWLNHQAKGITMPNLNTGILRALPLYFPSLPEQRRIAAILNKADAIRCKREEGIRLTEELLRSTFLEMFGDPATNPKGWVIGPVSKIVREMEGGKSILADTDESVPTPYRVLKVSAVTWADYRPHESKPVPADYAPPPNHVVKKGDLLFSRANTTELVGATVYVFDTPPNHLLPDKLWRFVWHDANAVDPQYVRVLFTTPAIKRELGKRATGTSGSTKNISKAKLMTIPIPLPPPDVQRKFGEFAMAQHRLHAQRRNGVSSALDLFGSLVQRAFHGEL
jgi:type I restriction enzyme, S subunit